MTAYEMQNKFLNKEVLELNQLRQQAIDREQKLFLESSDWEAKFYQIQSKYLLLLNELHNPQVNMQICNVYHAYAMYIMHNMQCVLCIYVSKLAIQLCQLALTALQVMVSASRQEMVGHLLKVFNT